MRLPSTNEDATAAAGSNKQSCNTNNPATANEQDKQSHYCIENLRRSLNRKLKGMAMDSVCSKKCIYNKSAGITHLVFGIVFGRQVQLACFGPNATTLNPKPQLPLSRLSGR